MPFAPLILHLLLSALSAVPPPVAVHVVIDTERAYMGAVQKTQIEYWLAPDKTWVSQRGRVTISRRDLGVRWRLDPAKKTYLEEPLAAPTAEPSPPANDIHSARYDYEPDYEWSVTPVGRTTVTGRDCREYSADGQADYSQTTLKFAIGPRLAFKTDPDINQILAGLARFESVSRFLRDAARTHGNGCLMSYEETLEPAIAPTIIQRARISTLETVPLPAGIFDVPDGFARAGK
jgi:hypothetical protein